jgi:hypothetical protein
LLLVDTLNWGCTTILSHCSGKLSALDRLVAFACHHMFVRFRQCGCRLQISVVDTRRVNGTVRHEHVASFGSVPLPPSIADRIDFWERLHDRLAKLGNRIGSEHHAKILGATHVRVPMVTLDERRALQLDDAKEDLRQWSALEDMHAATAAEHKALIARAERTVAQGVAAAAEAGASVQRAKERIERIERGEDVPGGKPLTPEDMEAILRKAGCTDADLRRMHRLAEIPEAMMDELFAEDHKRREAAHHAAVNAIWRRWRQQQE